MLGAKLPRFANRNQFVGEFVATTIPKPEKWLGKAGFDRRDIRAGFVVNGRVRYSLAWRRDHPPGDKRKSVKTEFILGQRPVHVPGSSSSSFTPNTETAVSCLRAKRAGPRYRHLHLPRETSDAGDTGTVNHVLAACPSSAGHRLKGPSSRQNHPGRA